MSSERNSSPAPGRRSGRHLASDSHDHVQSDQLLDVSAVARRLGVCTKTVRRLIDDGKLRRFKVGRLIRISEDDLVRFLEQSRQ